MTGDSAVLKAPFPYFGGKSRVAHLVWERFGDVPNYVEPFFGSGAVLLGRPHPPRTETVNDLDCMISNFWRAIAADPGGVAHYADWPVSEVDIHARHLWLTQQEAFRERMKTDPEYFDAKIAGWWVWGISQWIGSGWCSKPEWRGRGNGSRAARGVHAKRPQLKRSNNGVHRQLPSLGDLGRGVAAAGVAQQIPRLSGAQGVTRKLPHLSGAQGDEEATPLGQWFEALAQRLRRVRVCCGDWIRILGPSPTTKIGLTGVFLDPPYASDRDDVYNEESRDVAHAVREWAIAHDDDPMMRIALCGYAGEHEMPASWECVAWKAPGGYGNQGADTAGRKNSHKERIWFNRHCLRQPTLFDGLEETEES